MGLNRTELAILSLLLQHKSPNSRTSIVVLSNDMLPIKVESGRSIDDIQEIRNILNSLEKKGIIKIEDLQEVFRAESTDSEARVRLTELDRLNLMYILGSMKDEEYERLFSQAMMQQSGEGWRGLLPLTLIQRYIAILRIISTISYIDFKHYDTLFSHIGKLRESNSLIENNLVALLQSVLSIFSKYVQYVAEIANKGIEENASIGFIYLYPFLQPFTKKIKTKRIASDAELEKLRREIQVEKEIISVLEMLKEDMQKIERHKEKLQTLENKLKDLESYQEKEIFIVTLSTTGEDTDTIKDGLINLLGRPPPNLQHIVGEFIDMLTVTLYAKFFKDLARNREGNIEIDLHTMLEGFKRQEHKIEGEQYLLRVSLIWMNEYCPAMQDSIIGSEGRELTLCKNTECFVVYHKRCVDSLRRAGVDTCLVCGGLIT